MIKYNVKDILRQAKQVADLENSDFISYEEDMNLLNNAYMALYQKSINAGDSLYVQRLYLDEDAIVDKGDDYHRAYKLPCDFFQLYSIKTKSLGRDVHMIPRHTKDMSEGTTSYEIKNDCLMLYGRVVTEVEIQYFPTPRTLFMKAKDIPLKDYEGKPVALYKNCLVCFNDAVNTLTAFDLTTGEDIRTWQLATEEDVYSLGRVFAGTNGIIAKLTLNGEEKVLVSNYDEEGTIEANTGKIVVRADDGVFLEEPASVDVTSMLLDNENEYTINLRDGKEYINDEVELAEVDNVIDLFEDGKLFITSANGIQTIYDVNTDDLYFNGNRTNKYISASDYNLATGYGSLVYRAGKGYYITSCFEDTDLDYPNNVYYTLLSYMLAMSYKTKQNADTSALSVTYNETLNEYYDTLRRDSNQPIRLTNVYR